MKYGWCAAFPGREAVLKGLDKSFYRDFTLVRNIFEEADEILKVKLEKFCYTNEKIEFTWQTICLVTHCYAIYKVMEVIYGKPNAFVGYSQGEFTAFAASDIIKFSEILLLIKSLENILYEEKVIGECMYRIVNVDILELLKACRIVDNYGNKVSVSSYISDKQNIISGLRNNVMEVIQILKRQKNIWAIDLHSDRAYHSPMCNQIAEKSKSLFNKVQFYTPSIPVFNCYDGLKNQDKNLLKEKLSKQINHPIRWNRIIKGLVESNIFNLVEIGPGCTVSGNSRIAHERINCSWIGSTDNLW